jgi:hypothetical protein
VSTIEYIRDADGTVLGSVCVTTPLTDDERAAMAELFAFVRDKAKREDPHNVRADKQRRALDRVHKRQTAVCATVDCARVAGHEGECMDQDGYEQELAAAIARGATPHDKTTGLTPADRDAATDDTPAQPL